MEEGNKSNLFPLSMVAAVVAIAGYFMYSSALKSHRPAPSELVPVDESHVGHVPARLWEDPFTAIERFDQRQARKESQGQGDAVRNALAALSGRKADQRHDWDAFRRDIVDRVTEGTKLHVMLVMVPRSPSAEDYEVRLRSRRALQAALAASAYTPEETRHLGYLDLSWTHPPGGKNGPRQPHEDKVPYELYHADRLYPSAPSDDTKTDETDAYRQKPENVLVLWVNDTVFADYPLIRLAQLVDLLDQEVLGCRETDPFFDVIGPSSSDTLLGIIQDAKRLDETKCTKVKPDWPWLQGSEKNGCLAQTRQRWKDVLEKTRIFSHRSTVPPEWLLYHVYGNFVEPERKGGDQACQNRPLKHLLEKHVGALVRTIGTDRDLAEQLWKELKNREVTLHPEDADDRPIALIAEWDTIYGRTFPLTFRVARKWMDEDVPPLSAMITEPHANRKQTFPCIRSSADEDGDRDPAQEVYRNNVASFECALEKYRDLLEEFNDAGEQSNRLSDVAREIDPARDCLFQAYYEAKAGFYHARAYDALMRGQLYEAGKDDQSVEVRIYSYARGVDGKSPFAGANGGRTSSETLGDEQRDGEPKKSAFKLINQPEQPLGQGQFDYIRRVAKDLKERNVAAVGIVGTDVYDKLLILQAVREELGSNAILFTTDLDARFYHHENFDAARNLIVASHFGLKLRGRYRQDPGQSRYLGGFRESYQTALFLACRLSLGLPKDGDWGDEKVSEDQVRMFLDKPRLFEIGRERAVDISETERPKDVTAPFHWYLHPAVRSKTEADPFQLVLCFVVVPCIGLVGFWLAHRQIAGDEKVDSTEKSAYVGLSAAFVVFDLLLAYYFGWAYDSDLKNEPLSFTSGASAWPSLLLRSLAVFLSAYFIISIAQRIRANNNRLRHSFGLQVPEDSQRSTPASRTVLQRVREDAWHGLRDFAKETWEHARRFWSEEEKSRDQIWLDYQVLGKASRIICFVIVVAVVYLSLACILFEVWGKPFVPVRGGFSRWIGVAVTWSGIISMLTLVFYVVYVTWLCGDFVNKMRKSKPRLSTELPSPPAGIVLLRPEPDVTEADEWSMLRVIEERTSAIGGLILYPAIILLMMVISRNRWIDDWNWPPSLIALCALHASILLLSAYRLRRNARFARRDALARLRDQKRRAEPESAEQIQKTMDDIRSLRSGAFSPLAENPVLGAVLIPSGGYSVVALLELVLQR